MHWAADGRQKKNQIGSQPKMQTVFEVKIKLAEWSRGLSIQET